VERPEAPPAVSHGEARLRVRGSPCACCSVPGMLILCRALGTGRSRAFAENLGRRPSVTVYCVHSLAIGASVREERIVLVDSKYGKIITLGAGCLMILATLCACSEDSQLGGGNSGATVPAAVDNRVKVGDNTWIFEPGNDAGIVRLGALESFEIVNDTDADILPEVELNEKFFRVISDGCNVTLKSGQACVIRGEWVEGGPRRATLDVAVTKQNVPGAAKEKISVPLQSITTTDAPTGKEVSPTPVPTSPSPSPSETSTTGTPTPSETSATGTPTPSETSTTGTPTPSSSATGTSTGSTSPSPAPSPSATLGGSVRP